MSKKSDHHEMLDNGHGGVALPSNIHGDGHRDDDGDGGIISEAG